MIPVDAAPEPHCFDEKVRQPGLRSIAEMVGESVAKKRPGPKRKAKAGTREQLTPDDFPPYWRECTGELLRAYSRVCAYACLYIHSTTGAATVDHWAPKSRAWDKVYEWGNYRLACSIMNSRKREYGDVLDPFEVEDGMFGLDLVKLKAVPGPEAGGRKEEVQATISRLGLDSTDYAEALADYYHAYLEHHIDLPFLERHAPFLAREMRRQGKLLDGDT